jgi:serine/threonine protein kinase
MDSERFKRVERIYHSILKISPEKRSSFLQKNCGNDLELRREVESLLSYENEFDSRIDTPPESLVSEIFSESEEPEFLGKQINQYKIISFLGKGGMGKVYLAYDSKLERKVAIKLITGDSAPGTNKINRFFREAKSASALNHPNILTVHEIGELTGTYYIVTEFIEGRTLKHYLAEENLSLDSILEIALQIVSALSAAHEAGITHRDIKPDNIMIKKGGFVKVLDFGLAKLTDSNTSNEIDPEAATKVNEMTAQGLIIGTPKYMSPEQARGQKIDSRTDIFSFGIVLYEMIAGTPPFSGVNEIDTIGSILKDEPKKISEHLPEIPNALEHLVGKALRKDREQRYQNIKELYIDLNDIKKSIEPDVKVNQNTNLNISAKTLNTTGSIVSERRFSLVHALIFLLIFAVGIGAFWWFKMFQNNTDQIEQQLKATEIVNWNSSPGEVYSVGSFSPDGKMVAFASTRGGAKNIWIKQTTSGEAIQITKDEFSNEKPIWSPGGEELAFFSTRGNQAGIWRIPILGGSPKLVATTEDGGIQLRLWSKSDLVYYESNHDVFAVDISSGQTKRVTDFDSKSIKAESISISPDEKQIAYTTVDGDQWSVWTKDLNDEQPKKLFSSASEIKNTFWHSDNERFFYSAIVDGTFQIFVTDISGTSPKQLTFAEKDSYVLDVSTDGTKILFGSTKEDSDIWGINLKDAKEFIAASDINAELWANVSPAGKTIAYQSIKNLSQGNNLFTGKILIKKLNSDEQLTEISPEGLLPVWSPDGQTLAYMRVVGEKYRIETIKPASGEQKLLAADDVSPITNSILPYNRLQTSYFSWSPDSSKIAYISNKSGQVNIWLVNPDGSNDIQLTTNNDAKLNIYCPLWSPDGKKIAFTSRTNTTSAEGKNTFGVWLIDTETKNSELMTEKNVFYRLIGWRQNGEELAVASTAGSETSVQPTEVSLLKLEIGSGKMNSFAVLKETYLYNIFLSPNGENIAFAAHREGKDNIWLIPAFSGGKDKILTDNKDVRLYFSSLAWSPDNNSIFFGKQSRYSLLSMLSNFK